jgi:hypothetical protein
MSVDTIRTGGDRTGEPETEGGVVDVTGVRLRDLRRVVGGRDAVGIERHGGRTYVVADD